MDDLFSVGAWAEPGSLEFYLREALPDDYVVVADLTVRGRPLDAVVVGPQWLCVLYARDWAGEVHPAEARPVAGAPRRRPDVKHPNPAQEVRLGEEALQAFMQDEFPEMRLAFRHLVVLTNPEATVVASEEYRTPGRDPGEGGRGHQRHGRRPRMVPGWPARSGRPWPGRWSSGG